MRQSTEAKRNFKDVTGAPVTLSINYVVRLPVLINKCTKLLTSADNILQIKSKTSTLTTSEEPKETPKDSKLLTLSSTARASTGYSLVVNGSQSKASDELEDKINSNTTRKTLHSKVTQKASDTLGLSDLRTKEINKQKVDSFIEASEERTNKTSASNVELSATAHASDLLQAVSKPYQAKRSRAKTFSTKSPKAATRSKRIKRGFAALNDKFSADTATTITTTSVLNNSRKRIRIMSLYERHYQSDDTRSQQTGVVSNGYLSSTRNSSSASSNMHSDENTDISNQYYIAASSASATASAASALANGSSSNYAPSIATLCNIGNTCYLNSVVYTLRFAPQFVHNLHHLIVDLSTIQQNIGKHRASKSSSLGRNISGAQIENARSWSSKDLASFDNYNAAALIGNNSKATGQLEAQKSCQQLLTEKLHELYQNLHRNEIAESAEPFHADTLLHAIQDVSSIFEGNQQQDAHEFLMCVLNSIRETCQTLIKAIADCPEEVLNGCISSIDQSDGQNVYSADKDVARSTQSTQTNSGGSNTTSSSLSSNNITKPSFFTRKSKRKDESKSSKNQRLQSPIKESTHTTVGSNSLFYLNTVDLSGANGKQQQQAQPQQQQTANTSNESSSTNAYSSTAATTAQTTLPIIKDPKAGGDDNSQDNTSLKDKDRLAEKIRQLGLDFFRDDFEGITVSTTKCLSCETITEQKESMIDIAVPVPITDFVKVDSSDKPNSFIQNSCITREYFRGENKYRCEQCIGYTEAIRSISYEVLPRLLVIQLSRFSGGMEKINSYIPTSFTLQCFCSKCCELNDSNKLHIYKLYSVITHVGATMSVGHYIAYTCSLDWANEYINCPKDMRRNQTFGNVANGMQKNASTSTVGAGNGTGVGGVGTNTGSSQSSAASAAASVLASSGTSLMKKMKFGRSKASSSGDMSKNVKNLNGVTSKAITNGIEKLSMNATCHSLRCCATHFKGNEAASSGTPLSASHNSNSGSMVGGLYISNNSDMGDENLQNGSSHHHSNNSSANYSYSTSGYGSTGRGGGGGGGGMRGGSKTSQTSCSTSSSNNAEPIWYMCDDDKIKAMTQREFEELLSPSRKITITPYLLFYARIDLQTISTSQPTPPKQQAQTTNSSPPLWTAGNDASSLLQRGQMDKM